MSLEQPENTSQGINRTETMSRATVAAAKHELRTPMNQIIGYCEMLLEEAGEKGLDGFVPDLQRIHDAGKHLLSLLNDLFDESRTFADTLDPRTIRHELRTPLNQILGYSELLLEEAEDEGSDFIIPDLERIHSAAKSLLELISLVFDPSREYKPQENAVSEPTSVQLPDKPANIAISAKQQTGTLLVVDDNEVNRDMLSRRLERQGYTVAAADGGRCALEMVQNQAFDLILLDILMPEMNGYQVLETLKADEKLREIPVIMISALDEVESVVRCIEIGAEDYLPKPFNPVILRARIGACLEKKHLRDLEIEYLEQVAKVTDAAGSVETGDFTPQSLDGVAGREDALGQLARVFQRMAREVAAREQRLKEQVRELKIEIDEVKKAKQVAEITETDYFQDLQKKARGLRKR